jgi:branched-chain amino acid transport system substrate-binding protein
MMLAAALAVIGTPASAQIVIGQTAGFTGAVAAGVKEGTDGAKLYLDAINERGGVNGQKIELISMDDKFDAKLAAENAQKLIDQGADRAVPHGGTPHTQAIMPLLDRQGAADRRPPPAPWCCTSRCTPGSSTCAPPTSARPSGGAPTWPPDRHEPHRRAAVRRQLRRRRRWPAPWPASKTSASCSRCCTRSSTAAQARLRSGGGQDPAQAASPGGALHGSARTVADGYAALRARVRTAQMVTLSNNASSRLHQERWASRRAASSSARCSRTSARLAYPLVKEALELQAPAARASITPAMLEGFAAAKVLVEGLRRAGPTRRETS